MYLAIDIGNSNAHLGLFNQNTNEIPDIIKSFTIPCDVKYLLNFFKFLTRKNAIQGLIVSDACGLTSIAHSPELEKIKNNIHKFILLKSGLSRMLKFKYYPKNTFGTDRLADCIGAYKIYKQDCLVIDFGTATTFNVVSKNGYFFGGLITPGIKNLICAYPPHLTKKINTPIKNRHRNIFAASTAQALKSGIYLTFASMIERIKKDMEAKQKNKLVTIATGNGIKLFPDIQTIFDVIDFDLTLKGLAIIYQNKFNK